MICVYSNTVSTATLRTDRTGSRSDDLMMKRSPDDCEQTSNKCQPNCDSNTNNSNEVQQKDLVYVNVYLPELQTEVCPFIYKCLY